MFQYTKENILNDASVISCDGTTLKVKGYGEYNVANIVDATIYRTEGKAGVPAKKTVTVPAVDNKEYILSFRVVTPNQYLAEYASPNWEVFGKPIIVGYNNATGALQKAIDLAIPDGNKFIKATVSGTSLVLEATTPYMDFDKISLTDADGKVTFPAVANTVARVEPFATKEWIIENLRFPTYSNIRYNSAADMPSAALYDELAFTYKVPRVGLGGLSGVGQAIDAVTRHIFYVPAGSITTLTGLTVDKEPDTGAATTELLDEYETEKAE